MYVKFYVHAVSSFLCVSPRTTKDNYNQGVNLSPDDFHLVVGAREPRVLEGHTWVWLQ